MSILHQYNCVVTNCKSSSIKTPEKLFIKVPDDVKLKNIWLNFARRDPLSFSTKTKVYLCEDHFNLEGDMENYTRYKLMGSVKRIRMKPNCIPTRFEWINIKEVETTFADKVNATHSPSNQGLHKQISSEANQDKMNKIVQVQPSIDYKAVQTSVPHRSKATQFRNPKFQNTISSPIKIATTSTATSPHYKNLSQLSAACNSKRPKLLHVLEEFSSEPTITPESSSQDFTLYETECRTTSDSSDPDQLSLNLQNTIKKIKKKPRLYIGVPKQIYFIIDYIEKHTGLSEKHILLCLTKIRLNRTFSQLADDFGVCLTQASYIFAKKMPIIVNVLVPFIKSFSRTTIIRNLPIAFRHKYHRVTSIIDCLEIEIQKPTKALHQALTWSEYKKANTMKYLVACTPDGLVSFISGGYGGRVTDVQLVQNSKFLDTLEPGARILADRGFKHLKQYLSQNGFSLLKPPSVATGTKLSKAEARQTKQIASLRIHVERVIHRIREFGMLKPHSVINNNLIKVLDQCILTACALINLQDSLIK